MDKREKYWLYFLVAIFLIFNVLTLSKLIPWQKWLVWSNPTPDKTVEIHYANYQIQMDIPVEIQRGEYVEFMATSADVTYGFGVFRKDGSLVMQMQVLPGRENHILWKFDEAGWYDVRSTEYSGPGHSNMFLPDAIVVKE
jgi:cytochrome c oxidase subunit II